MNLVRVVSGSQVCAGFTTGNEAMARGALGCIVVNLSQFFVSVLDENGLMLAIAAPWSQLRVPFLQANHPWVTLADAQIGTVVNSTVTTPQILLGASTVDVGPLETRTLLGPLTGGAQTLSLVGPDGLALGSSTDNPDTSVLLTQLSGSSATDGQSNASTPAVGGMMWNGATWDRVQNRRTMTLLASAARTTTATSAIQTMPNSDGVMLSLSITSAPNTSETLQVFVGIQDPVTNSTAGTYANLATAAGSTLQSGTVVYWLICQPGADGSPVNTKAKNYALGIPAGWVGAVTPSGSSSWTYSLGASML